MKFAARTPPLTPALSWWFLQPFYFFRWFRLISTPIGLSFGLISAVNAGVPSGTLFARIGALTNTNTTIDFEFGGRALTVSADGDTALVGAAYNNVNGALYAGEAFLYTFSNGAWNLTYTFDDPDGTTSVTFGSAVALSANGTAALISSSGSPNNRTGNAYLYQLVNGSWVLTHEFNNPNPGLLDGDSTFGSSGVALSGDGNVVLIADTGSGNGAANEGEVYVFSQQAGSWTLAASIPDPDAQLDDVFGSSLAINSTGTTFLIGSGYNGGRAYSYTFDGSSVTQSHEFDPPVHTTLLGPFGISGVSLSGDGLTALIGDAGEGAYLYKFDGNSWNLMQTIDDPDGQESDEFGSPVALSTDGTTALIGSDAAVFGQPGAGKAYLFSLINNQFEQVYEFDDPQVMSASHFGASGLEMSGDAATVFISSGDMVNGAFGAAPVYVYRPWNQSTVDVSLTLVTPPSQIVADTNTVFTSVIANNSDQLTATDLFFSENYGASFVSANSDGGTCYHENGFVICTLASLAPKAVWQPSVTLAFPQSNVGVQNGLITAAVSASEPDSNLANNSSSVTFNIVNSPSSNESTNTKSSGGGGTLGLIALFFIGLLSLIRVRFSSR